MEVEQQLLFSYFRSPFNFYLVMVCFLGVYSSIAIWKKTHVARSNLLLHQKPDNLHNFHVFRAPEMPKLQSYPSPVHSSTEFFGKETPPSLDQHLPLRPKMRPRRVKDRYLPLLKTVGRVKDAAQSLGFEPVCPIASGRRALRPYCRTVELV